MPERIRLSRAKGWRKPAGAVVVSRPSRWGNPFTITECLEDDPTQTDEEARARCVRLFEGWLKGELELSGPDLRRRRVWILEHIGNLAGRNLACWCYLDHPCHADVLLELANAAGGPS